MNDFMDCAAYNWPNWSHLQRMDFLRSLRLHIIAEKKREEREQAFKEAESTVKQVKLMKAELQTKETMHAEIKERVQMLEENETIQINAGTRHRVKNIKDVKLKILELQSGSVLSEKDIVRIQDDYGRT